jgi:hypothetical protein
MSLDDLFQPTDRLFAVSRIFARARKGMNLAEQKTFVYALSQLRFSETPKTNVVYMDKKTLGKIVGVNSDPDHLSVDLHRTIGDLPKHSFIKIADRDLDFYDSGFIITRLTMLKNRVRVKFEEEYLRLFTGLTSGYLTMWSTDIFRMNSKRSVQFYEYLRQITDPKKSENSVLLGIRAIKEMFEIPESGRGSYMRGKDGFDRANFEKYVIDPICEDLQHCRMISLIVQPDGKLYEKVKRGNRIAGYRFYWTFTAYPAVASAEEVKQIQERPEVLKVAKDILFGEKKKKNQFTEFEQNQYDWDRLESELLGE